MANDSPIQPTIGELVGKLTSQLSTLVRDELQLAQAQLAEKGKRLGAGAGAFAFAGVLAFFAVGVLIAAAVLGLAEAVPAWLAALIVGVALLLLAGAVAFVGKVLIDKSKAFKPDPVSGLKSDVSALKDGLSS
ncbi:protein of unknown function DUF1469 [Beutenbergia cavernae DSM 12333]|uniref:Integral membrane protein n=1 Tax=Beutenbergia cavernae (strain ATCC BAA-8 / DSM 12333 / CCUG 43141 / JCM 11478 / NBRC 16432 / NCIMB 13614 / HKI 0122) TaxID=471853 RepID=C5C2R0_BEUC1|nr:phage holin family protein [Beutenbergia cavernae]ACQ81754.1 protein of unknown function DUF1469 [Beutenbergia cavernae DSM 12333]